MHGHKSQKQTIQKFIKSFKGNFVPFLQNVSHEWARRALSPFSSSLVVEYSKKQLRKGEMQKGVRSIQFSSKQKKTTKKSLRRREVLPHVMVKCS